MARPSELRDEAIDLYVGGLTYPQVINRLGVSHRQIREWVREAGVARSRGSRPPNAALEDAEFNEDVAYEGGWVRDGLIWRPTQPDAA